MPISRPSCELDEARKHITENTLEDFRHVLGPRDHEAIGMLLTATAAPPEVPRPDDMAELTRLVAMELRKRGIWARANRGWVDIDRHTARFRAYVLYNPDFDHLGPIGCANAIQAEEAKRAQEWASDT